MKNVNFRNDILPLKNVLYRLALRITMSHEDAEDIVQDTLMKVWNRRESLEGIENIEAYMTTICRNLALDRMRRADQGNVSLEEEPTDVAHTNTPAEKMIMNDRIETVRKLINQLPEKQRSAIHRRKELSRHSADTPDDGRPGKGEHLQSTPNCKTTI